MSELSSEARKVVDDYLAASDAGSAATEASLQAAIARIEAGDPGLAITGTSSAGIGTKVLVALLVAGGALGGAVFALGSGEDEPVSPVAAANEPVAAPAPVASVADEPGSLRVAPEPTPAAESPTTPVSPEPAAAAQEQPPREPVRKATRATPVDVPKPEASPEDELRLLQRSRAAGRAGDHARALALLESHANQFPGSQFATERDKSRITVLCKLGRSDRARSVAKALRKRDPKSGASVDALLARCGE